MFSWLAGDYFHKGLVSVLLSHRKSAWLTQRSVILNHSEQSTDKNKAQVNAPVIVFILKQTEKKKFQKDFVVWNLGLG